uniref:Uncharacterized protein n=1 Tax=viral metagenome TaxID=1070528 RepID=A0A6C0HBK7_9ZZZZ
MFSKISFVTAFIDIYKDTPFDNKTIEWRCNKFRDIAAMGFPIIIFVCKNTLPYIEILKTEFENLYILEVLNMEDTWVYKNSESMNLSLPYHRNMSKDTREYMYVINSKAEFLYKAVEANPWNSTHFAWIDFSISYIFKEEERTFEYLNIFAQRTINDETCLLVPGCWREKISLTDTDSYINNVVWRFCGGFLLGDANSIKKLFELYREHFVAFLNTHKTIVWEVNFWAWLEANDFWTPRWYEADHNDSIIQIPADICCRNLSLSPDLRTTTYEYPAIENFGPGSASYVYFKGEHLLNTRYINYSILENGCYDIKDPKHIIISRNVFSKLNGNLEPIKFIEMKEINIRLPSKNCYIYGLEDIRLYSVGDTLKFIATNINFSPTGYNRMLIGEYDIIDHTFNNCIIAKPPYETHCEKNWIPLLKNGKEYFIYKWFPMEIGTLNAENELVIEMRYPIKSPWFHKVRGSSIFVDNGEHFVGVVHFSEETTPRRYYHMLVSLDKETFKPLKYSEIFHFQHLGIEFCIGFTIKNGEYVFWISQMDREPLMISISIDKLKLMYDFKGV